MTALWSSDAAARATGGRSRGPHWEASGIVIDSRQAAAGDLFVALPGDRVDGHDYAAAALRAGAAAVVATRPPAGLGGAAPLLLVDDGLEALRRLAADARARSRARIVGVTGSVGKTGSKDGLARALAAFGAVHASEGNLNNHIGAPLSLARLPAGAPFAVFELGMNHAGEIAPLSRLIRPHVVLVTNVAPVHIGHFRHERDIAMAKAEIFAGLADDGAAVLNRDNPWFELLAGQADAAGCRTIVSFGRDPGATVRIRDIAAGPDGTAVRVDIDGRPLDVALDAIGPHWGVNAVGVLACIHALGLDVRDAAAALRGLRAARGRGGQIDIALAGGGCLRLIDESYNASPAAMRAAFAVFGFTAPAASGRRVAILGDMLELGAQAEALHAGLADDLIAAAPDLVFTVGPMMRELRRRLPGAMRGAHADASDGIVGPVAAALRPGDVVLVKGSLGTRMAPVVAAIEGLSMPSRSPAAKG